MSWMTVLKQTALVGKKARNPNIWLHRKATTRNLGRPMKSKPQTLSTIPIEVPQEQFEKYYSFFAEFFANGGWKEFGQGSVQQSINNSQVERVIKDFESGKVKVTTREYSPELDTKIEEIFFKTIERMKSTGELLMAGSRDRIREGRDMLRYAKDLETSYDRGR